MEELCEILHIPISRSTPWHLHDDGQVKRTNRTHRRFIQSFVNNCSDSSGNVALLQCLLAYCSVAHSSMGHTPFALIYDREIRLTLDTYCTLPLPLHEPTYKVV